MTAMLATMAAALWVGDNPAAVYLVERGLNAEAWHVFGLGYSANALGQGPAIAMPWYRGGALWGIRYRLIQPKPGGQKIISETGSRFGGLLFGAQASPLVASRPHDNGFDVRSQRTLVICEGEFNAMSIQQVGDAARCHVLSLGSESARLPASLPAIAARYRSCIVWMDREDYARQNAQTLDAAAFWSEKDGRKIDANDHLRAGTLGPLLAALLRRATPQIHQEALHWDLYDAGLA